MTYADPVQVIAAALFDAWTQGEARHTSPEDFVGDARAVLSALKAHPDALAALLQEVEVASFGATYDDGDPDRPVPWNTPLYRIPEAP